MHYFTGTADQALAEWLRVTDDFHAGRTTFAAGWLMNRFAARSRVLSCNAQIVQVPRNRGREKGGPPVRPLMNSHTVAAFQAANS